MWGQLIDGHHGLTTALFLLKLCMAISDSSLLHIRYLSHRDGCLCLTENAEAFVDGDLGGYSTFCSSLVP